MHNIEELKVEKEKCRKKIVTFSVLTGTSILLLIIGIIAYGLILAAILSNPNASNEVIANRSILASVLYVLYVVILVIATLVFIPFIVINSVKHGKRRRLLNKIEKEETGILNG